MQHNKSVTRGLRGEECRRPDDPRSARCRVYVAHRRHLLDWHRFLLDHLETERCRRYRLAADRDRFTLAAALLRVVAGKAFGVEASTVVIDRSCNTCGDPHGRPRLPGTGLQVSISHSGDVVAVAVTPAGPVGVDVEQFGIGHTDLVPTVCTAPEIRHVGSSADFYTYWTRKEAVLKATGEGLHRRMTTIEVAPPGAPPALVSLDGSLGVACRMADLPLPGYAGAVAVLTTCDVSFDVVDADPLLRSAHHTPKGRSPLCA